MANILYITQADLIQCLIQAVSGEKPSKFISSLFSRSVTRQLKSHISTIASPILFDFRL